MITCILVSADLAGTGVQLLRFLSPNTARGVLHRPDSSWTDRTHTTHPPIQKQSMTTDGTDANITTKAV